MKTTLSREFSTYQAAIDKGRPVMTNMLVGHQGKVIITHNVLVVGYGSNDIIILN